MEPLEVWCPVDGELETVTHALLSCQFLLGAFDIDIDIDTAFRLHNTPAIFVKHMLQHDPITSLMTPAGFTGSWGGVIGGGPLFELQNTNFVELFNFEADATAKLSTAPQKKGGPRDRQQHYDLCLFVFACLLGL